MKIKIFLIVFILLAGFCFSSTAIIGSTNYVDECFFSTQLDSKNKPLDKISQISLSKKEIFIVVNWINLPIQRVEYNCKISDGKGQLVASMSMIMNVTDSSWQSRSKYVFDKLLDSPGTWKFEIFIDNKKEVEKNILVTDIEDQVALNKNKKLYLSLGEENLSKSVLYYGGNYLYASFGFHVFMNTIIVVKYSEAFLPLFGEDHIITVGIKQYYYKTKSEGMPFNFYFSPIYKNNLAQKDIGSIGCEFAFLDSGFSEPNYCFTLFPIAFVYNINSKSFNFSYELFKIQFRL